MRLKTALRLGRVSNLPTVWTNALAGAVLAGAGGFGAEFAVMLAAFSLFYVGGMFLNDACDAAIDAIERPERPIPAGEVARGVVFGWAFTMLVAGVALLGWVGYRLAPGAGAWPAAAGVALAMAIAFYDWNHKQNVFSPVVMGLCRVLVYVAAALCYSLALPAALQIGAALMMCYLIGLTYVAKQENLAQVENLWPLLLLAAPVIYGGWLSLQLPVAGLFWLAFTAWGLVALWFLKRRRKGDIPRAVVSLIAGISLLDAMLIAGTGAYGLALLGLAGFGATLFLQRYVVGT